MLPRTPTVRLESLLGLVLALTLTLGVTGEAHAWGRLGHQTVGEIATQLIVSSGNPISGLSRVSCDETLARGSTKPDEERSETRWQPARVWHYTTKPIDPRKLPTWLLPDAERGAIDVVTALVRLVEALGTVDVSRPGDQIEISIPTVTATGLVQLKMTAQEALRWLTHLVGDIHQPLHVGNEADRGSNWCIVRWQGRAYWMHELVDDVLVTSALVSIGGTAARAAQSLRETYRPVLVNGELMRFHARAWAEESAQLRRRFYPNLGDGTELGARYCVPNPPKGPRDAEKALAQWIELGKVRAEDIPDLYPPGADPSVAQGYYDLVRRQIALAGGRLESVLRAILSRN